MSLNLFCLSPLSSAGCSGFADCLLPLPFLLTFPVDHERDGVELALLREADLYGLYIDSARNERISLPKLHPLCARLPNAVSQAITYRTDDLSCDFLKCRPLQACRQAAAR
jgi:hypothetical protein